MPKKEKIILIIINSLAILFVFISFAYLRNLANAAIILMGCIIGINIGRILKNRKKININMTYIFLLIISISLGLFIMTFFKDSHFYLYSAIFMLFVGLLSFFNLLMSSK